MSSFRYPSETAALTSISVTIPLLNLMLPNGSSGRVNTAGAFSDHFQSKVPASDDFSYNDHSLTHALLFSISFTCWTVLSPGRMPIKQGTAHSFGINIVFKSSYDCA